MVRTCAGAACASRWTQPRYVTAPTAVGRLLNYLSSVRVVLTITAAMIVVMIATGAMTATVAMTDATTATLVTTVTLAMIGIVMTAAGRLPMVANAPGPHLVARIMTIVAPGRLLPGGMMIGGLQGTMIDEALMMFGEALTLILIAAGTNVGVTTRTNAMTKGRPEAMETTVGHAEDAEEPLDVLPLPVDRA